MPIVIDGYVVVSTTTLQEHAEHALVVPAEDGLGTRLWCRPCSTEIGREHRSTSLPCGCRDAADHADGLAIQRKFRRQYRIPRSTCVGCYMGDDGPSIHSCAIHPV